MKHRSNSIVVAAVFIAAGLTSVLFSQFGNMGGMGGGMGGVGSMGGMGGGMGGMGGGMGGVVEPAPIITYQQPTGPWPNWLVSGLASVESTENLRENLNRKISIESDQRHITELVELLKQYEILVELNAVACDEDGIVIQDCHGLLNGAGSIRELLRKSLSQQGLAYIVREDHIEIAPVDFVEGNPSLRYYNLGFIQSDSRLSDDIIAAITNSIEPDTWGGSSGMSGVQMLGQLLVVRATETAHLEIERLLARLSQTYVGLSAGGQSPAAVKQAAPVNSDNPFGQ